MRVIPVRMSQPIRQPNRFGKVSEEAYEKTFERFWEIIKEKRQAIEDKERQPEIDSAPDANAQERIRRRPIRRACFIDYADLAKGKVKVQIERRFFEEMKALMDHQVKSDGGLFDTGPIKRPDSNNKFHIEIDFPTQTKGYERITIALFGV